MLSLTLLAVPIIYGLGPSAKASYDVQVDFKGYIPILGGQQGEVGVVMKVAVEGLVPDAQGNPRAASEIVDFSLEYNGQKLPMSVENVREFFPRTTISLTPQGKVLKTDAPDAKLPFRLPALDQKRFPDITYLPIEFPSEGIEVGRAFSFKKRFGDSDAGYTVTPISISDALVELEIRMTQDYAVFEDSGGNVLSNEKDAVKRVSTKLEGSGKVVFDRSRGLVRDMDVKATALSKVVSLETKKESERKLDTRLVVKLKP